MKKKLKRNSNYKNVVLSDVLPYEVPVIFSNRKFYNFLNKYKICYIKSQNKKSDTLNYLIKNKNNEKIFLKVITILFGGKYENNQYSLKERSRLCFQFKIQHKEKSFRELSLPHPKTQLEATSFYEKYSSLILYYSNQSNFSMRKAVNVSKFIADKDELFYDKKRLNFSKTFFFNQKYSSIHRFYEGYHYQRAEKKFSRMMCFDISKCFDSIYTHSLAWAIYGKDYVKKNLGLKIDNTFASHFDRFMQYSNNAETNGIIIGPEFSRIFAELILQAIDLNVEKQLLNEKEKPLKNRRDYQMYRYVDDCFVFYNDESVIEKLLHLYEVELRKFKMGFNESKTLKIKKPIITELSIAKNEISRLLSKTISFTIEENDSRSKINSSFRIEKLITDFKTIIYKHEDIDYKDVLNYTLTVLYNISEQSVNSFSNYLKKNVHRFMSNDMELKKDQFYIEKKLVEFFAKIIEFTFFLYNVSPRVSPTIKAVNIISLILKTSNHKLVVKSNHENRKLRILNNQNKNRVKKKIYDEITLSLTRNTVGKNIQIETLYLLITMSQLGKDYRLTKNQIIKYLDIKENNDGSIEFRNTPNYFVCTTLLFYFKNSKEYESIKTELINNLQRKFEEIDLPDRINHSELVLLFFDLISCPFLSLKQKKSKILPLLGVEEDKEKFINFVNDEKIYFTTWQNFDLYKEIINKKASEAY